MKDLADNEVFTSPDGKRFAVVLVRGDVANDRVAYEIWTGCTEWEGELSPKHLATLYTQALTRDYTAPLATDLVHYRNAPVWTHDSRYLTFLWEDGKQVRQVARVDVDSGRTEFVTHHPTDVIDYNFSPKGTLLFSARPERPPLSPEQVKRGFVVENEDALSLVNGEVTHEGFADRYYSNDKFISRESGAAEEIHSRASPSHLFPAEIFFEPQFSPSERWLIIAGTPPVTPSSWSRYTDSFVHSQMLDTPGGILRRQMMQLLLVDLQSLDSRPLWDAPTVPLFKTTHVAWAPDEKTVVVAPTFLPVDTSNPPGLSGEVVAEVSVLDGSYHLIPMPREAIVSTNVANPGRGHGIADVRWRSSTELDIQTKQAVTYSFRKRGNSWEPEAPPHSQAKPSAGKVAIGWREDRTHPPRLIARRVSDGHERVLLDPNPGLLSRFALGEVRDLRWSAAGRSWRGRLYLPVHFQVGKKYPLVIQTHGLPGDHQFSLYGGPSVPAPGLGPDWGGGYIAQVLANHGIVTLQVEDKSLDADSQSPREPEIYSIAYEAAIQKLASEGVVDEKHVGLYGYSRTGWDVEYTVTHSKFDYAAAVAADNVDGNYLQMILNGSQHSYFLDNGAAPYGSGLQEWLKNSPAFNIEKLRTPLELTAMSPGLMTLVTHGWEMFVRARDLGLPVELYAIPDIEHGSHNLQNPRQVLVTDTRTLDWWLFWLKGEEDSDPAKKDQYARWHEMRRECVAHGGCAQ